jgi:hypothetical protein
MLSDTDYNTARRDLEAQLTKARRDLREQEQRLAQLKYEWGIAKRLRTRAPNEDEREKWRVQCDAYLGLVMQQEGIVEGIKEWIGDQQSRLADMNAPLPENAK